MTRYLLDTNVLLHLVNKSKGHERIAHQLTINSPKQLFISAIGERDSMIAGIATVHEMDVITDNVKEFARVPGILVYNWRENVIRRI